MVKKKRKKTKGNEYRYCRRQPTTTFNLNGHTIEYISEAPVVQKVDSAIQLLNDRVQNYMTGINKKTWNCESCVLEVLLVVSSEP